MNHQTNRAAPAAQPAPAQPVQAEPVAWMWQHGETGQIGFIDAWQVANGWEEANQRHTLCGPLYTAPPARDPKWVEEAMRLAHAAIGNKEAFRALRKYLES